MKFRYLILTLLLPLLQACSNDDEPEAAGEKRVVEIAKPFVSRISKGATATVQPSFTSFKLWAFVGSPSSYIFNDETVKEWNDKIWRTEHIEYWLPQKHYYFTGIAPGDAPGVEFRKAERGMGTEIRGGGSISCDINLTQGKTDLLYAFEPRSTVNNNFNPVDMEFRHLLSRITFTFINELGNPHYYINIYSIILKDLYGKGTIDMTTRNPEWTWDGYTRIWGLGINNLSHIYTKMTSEPVYILPINGGDMKPLVNLGTQVFFSTVEYGQNSGHQVTANSNIEAELPVMDLKPGRAYNIICHLKPENLGSGGQPLVPISFSVEETPWDIYEIENL